MPDPKGTKPSFKFLHVLLPHGPWHFTDSGRPYPYPAVGPGHADAGGWLNQAWPVQVNLAREMLQLSYADKLLGDVLTKLRAENILDKTLLVVTADHGEGFRPRPAGAGHERRHGADLSWVPMFLKMPNQTKGNLDERNWTHVDLVPTLADALHVKLPQQLDGQSALAAPRTTTDKFWFNTPGKKLPIPDPVGNYHKVIQGYGGVLGNAKSAADLYKLGPRPDLLGKPVSSLKVAGNSSLTVVAQRAVNWAARGHHLDQRRADADLGAPQRQGRRHGRHRRQRRDRRGRADLRRQRGTAGDRGAGAAVAVAQRRQRHQGLHGRRQGRDDRAAPRPQRLSRTGRAHRACG